MDTQALGTTALGRLVAALLARYNGHRRPKHHPGRARLSTDGVQEVTIRVRDGYHPNTIRVRAGCPVRLVFQRADDDPCLARVYLSEPPLSRRLTAFAATTVTFTPRQVGDHLFTCEEGRFRGHLIVEPPRPPRRGHEAAFSATSLGPTLRVLSVSQLRLMPTSGPRDMLRTRDIDDGVASPRRLSMADADRGAGSSQPWLPMIVGCALLLGGLVVSSAGGAGWGAAVILAALISCPLAIFAALRATESGRPRTTQGTTDLEENR